MKSFSVTKNVFFKRQIKRGVSLKNAQKKAKWLLKNKKKNLPTLCKQANFCF